MSWIHDTTLAAREHQKGGLRNIPQCPLPPANAPVIQELRPWLVPVGRYALPVVAFVLLLYLFWEHPMIGAVSTFFISMSYELLVESRLRRFSLNDSTSGTYGTERNTLNRRQLIKLALARPELAWATLHPAPKWNTALAAPGLPVTAYSLMVGTMMASTWSHAPKNIPLSLVFLGIFVVIGAFLFMRVRRVTRRSTRFRIEIHRDVLVCSDSSDEIPLSEFKEGTLKWDPAAGQEYLLLHRDGVDYPIQSQTWDPLDLLRVVKQSMPSLEIRSNDFNQRPLTESEV